MRQFRPYQADASAAILNSWKQFPSCITVVATGGGKTLIAAGTAARLTDHGRILFLANRNELCQQPLEVFREQTGIIPALEKAEFKAPLSAQVVIGSVQTLSRKARLERFPSDHFGYIFADECHMSVAASWKRIFDHFKGAKLCGITATPFRSDNKDLKEIFAAEAYRKPLFSLVDDGFLVDPDHVDKLSTAISLANVRVKHTTEGKEYDLQDAHDAIAPYFDAIAQEVKEKHEGRHILAFLPLVASSEKFVRACQAAGINAVHVDGEDPFRNQKLQAFKDGQITLLSNSNLLHTGVDMPICDATLNLRPTRSKVLYQQIVGRSTRTVPGLIDGIDDVGGRLQAIAASAKPRAYIIDPLWLTKDFDLVTPSFLIAQNQEIALEMNQRAGKSYSLRGLNRQVQFEREEKIRRRLEATARFRDRRVQADWFAACTGAHELLNYQAVFKWEEQAPTRFSCLLLAKAGIDPESVTSEGQAREVLRAIGRRRYQGLAELPELASIAESNGVTPELWKITKQQAKWS
jgi:superfamily II DNA or RNA helicase